MSAVAETSIGVTSCRFVWYELMTADAKAARDFYTKVIGWGAQESPVPGMDYTILAAGGIGVAGLMELPEQARAAGATPGWVGYVGVADVDASAMQVERLGGAICMKPTDIPSVGRFAAVADPQRAGFALFSPAEACREPPPVPEPGTPGHVGWRELRSSDWPKGFDFYAAMFGWEKDHAIDMGEMGVYQIFAIDGMPARGMMNRGAGEGAPFWRYYFNVEDIDAAAARVTEGGGTVGMGPMQVPGGKWIVQCVDPQGVDFALVGGRR